MRTISIDPITRIEGHLRVEVATEEGRIVRARSSGALFRGIEIILLGRHPLDAQRLTTRICGVCPIAHATAASFALEEALGISGVVPPNGVLLRNIIFASNWLHNHILHFYHLALPDFADFRASPLAPFLSAEAVGSDARFSAEERDRLVHHYLLALEVRRKAHELVALFGGKMPHEMAIVPGGVTYRPSLGEVAAFRFRLAEIRGFLENVYVPDVLLLAKRYADYFSLGKVGRFLSFGAFPLGDSRDLEARLFPAGVVRDGDFAPFNPQEIKEEEATSWYQGRGGIPWENGTEPDPEKREAYSWVKAPRYRGLALEVGPAARVAVGLLRGSPAFQQMARELLAQAGGSPAALSSVMGRHLSRAIEALFLAGKIEEWLSALDLRGPVAAPFRIPKEAQGQGFTDAPRGALGHWLRIQAARIAAYQVISPTTWNASPRDEKGNPGPIEEALEGTEVGEHALLVAGRIVRSFDPCMACAVH